MDFKEIDQNALNMLRHDGHYPKGICCCVNIDEKVSNTLQAFPKESPIPFRYCSNGLQELLSVSPNMSRHRFGHFLYFSIKAACFCLLRLKFEDATETFMKQ
jgi:hypothetical protein